MTQIRDVHFPILLDKGRPCLGPDGHARQFGTRSTLLALVEVTDYVAGGPP
jgi:hypothetical protein